MLQAGTLVSYSFDGEHIDTGPDTFRIFEYSRGTARLSPEFRYSGYYSVEIHDTAQDGDFPELQGYFPIQDSGTLYVHFAFMTPEPLESFNIALAGPERFRPGKDGIGFWLKNRDGYFYHVSDSIPRRLLPIVPFVWYRVDLSYRVAAGTYDLDIQEEYTDQPQVQLRDVPNAARSPGSRIDVFSFIGDLPDTSNAVLYVDDIEIRSDVLPDPGKLVAPGRRKLFTDYWHDLQQAARTHPECLPMRTFRDLGIGDRELSQLIEAGELQRLEQALQSPQPTPAALEEPATTPAIHAAAHWRRGCYLLEKRQPEKALQHFRQAEAAMLQARLYSISATLALAALGEFPKVDSRLATAHADWYGDERFAAAQAMVGLARDDHWSSEEILRAVASDLSGQTTPALDALWDGELSASVLASLQAAYPDAWRACLRNRLITEQYYYLLLWRAAYAEALDFAARVAEHLEGQGRPAGAWYELQGNAAFLMDDYDRALEAYEAALDQSGGNPYSVYLKLSDVFFRTGDYENERYYRELVYGSLAGRNKGDSLVY
jgi:hypothetical protein